MGLSLGTRLGPYEIEAPAGAGGMGEVYRARDTRLDRTVAIKVLPEQFATNPELRQRFEREARSISALNHPHICTLHDVGHQDGIDFLVMEYIQGESLADRTARGPLPVEQVLKIGMQIAEALEKAHGAGIIHRDLKPGNIMLSKSGAKLLDFGLAKPAGAVLAARVSSGAAGVTRTGPPSPVTEKGNIVGTFQYMSPEQVEGKEADSRSDIFALGAVLYEMATGKRAFDGKSPISVASAILEKDPEPISKAQPLTPPALEYVVAKCLAKDPEERIQSAHDVKLQLAWIAESGAQAEGTGAGQRKGRERFAWAVAAALLVVLIGLAGAWWLQSRQSRRTMYFSSAFPYPANDVALAPNGRTAALVAYEEHANKYVIWIYEVGSASAKSLAGTEGASHPFWSPDGKSIGFFADGKLKKVELTGEAPQVLCDAPHGRGGTWNRDGVILFSPNTAVGLYRISSGGGSPVQVTQPDPSKSETSHRWPVFLPDGKHFLYLAANFSGDFQKNTIYAGSLDSNAKLAVIATSSNAAYADPGYLLYVRDNALVVQRFDTKRLALQGDPHTITDEVQYFAQIAMGVFAAAGSDTLIVQTGTGADKSQLTWFDRAGKQIGTIGNPGLLTNPALSPDGRHVAFGESDKDGRHVDVWVRDLVTDAMTRLTFSPGLNELPIWAPDSRRLIFTSNQKLHWDLRLKNADGSGTEAVVAQSSAPTTAPWSWSRDGKDVLFMRDGELWLASWPGKVEKPLLHAVMVRNAQFSPDDKWLTYASNETGKWEVYVSPFPSFSSKWQVSQGGGEEPRWRGDGKELFFLSPEGKMMAVPVMTGNSFEAGSPITLFQTHLRQPISSTDMVSYDVSRDGKRFLINTKVDEPNTTHLSIMLHWASELAR